MIINLMGKELSERDATQISNHGWIETTDWLQIWVGKNWWKHSVRISCLCRVYNKKYCIFYYYLYMMCYTSFIWVKFIMKLQCIYMYQHYYFWGEAFKHLCVHHCMYSLRDAIIVNFEPGNGELWLRSWHHLHTHYGDASFPSTSWNICSICLFFFLDAPFRMSFSLFCL